MQTETRRPTCINHGCGKLATFSHKDEQGNRRWRIHCGHCQAASWGKWPHKQGVTPYKTGCCSNKDGHLGWKCFIDWNLVPKDFKGMTEVDHINGLYWDNRPENLQELCVLCHKYKGQRSGDYNRTKTQL